jgi:hypothetical protein
VHNENFFPFLHKSLEVIRVTFPRAIYHDWVLFTSQCKLKFFPKQLESQNKAAVFSWSLLCTALCQFTWLPTSACIWLRHTRDIYNIRLWSYTDIFSLVPKYNYCSLQWNITSSPYKICNKLFNLRLCNYHSIFMWMTSEYPQVGHYENGVMGCCKCSNIIRIYSQIWFFTINLFGILLINVWWWDSIKKFALINKWVAMMHLYYTNTISRMHILVSLIISVTNLMKFDT